MSLPHEAVQGFGTGDSRIAPTGWGADGCRGVMCFDSPWWLRGGPSSQSSPVGRRGRTSRPHLCFSARVGWAKGRQRRGGRPRPGPLSVSPRGGKARGEGESRIAPTGSGRPQGTPLREGGRPEGRESRRLAPTGAGAHKGRPYERGKGRREGAHSARGRRRFRGGLRGCARRGGGRGFRSST